MSFAQLVIYDLASRSETVLLATDRHIEAPNWHPHDGTLIVNAEGGLFRVPLDAPDLHPIEVAGLSDLNNDHGISPDGRMLVVSNSPGRGTSMIHALPIDGGVPHRLTSQAPSWWHGWAPDGQRHAYTAVRAGQFCIATCALTGEDERILITGSHHYDGPDYTPDGEWIWFNSDRAGHSNLWRMRPDGGDVNQMTDDETVDWFPHPAPDGRHVLYLAYPPGTTGHPFGRDVALRLMPSEGGAHETLTEFYGGQGTLNVPCWAPDSTRFAYIRYAKGD